MNFSNYKNEMMEALGEIRVSCLNEDLDLGNVLDEIIKKFVNVRESRKKIMIIGNGGSAAIASHVAIDLWKNCGIRALAFNDSSLLTCISNDFSYRE